MPPNAIPFFATMPAHRKYRPFPRPALPDRQWPRKAIEEAPVWCSVDLRDGNQALFEPMEPARKLLLFKALTGLGFKEIEVGFPAASQTDYDFVRKLVEDDLIPSDVTIQVLTQAREALIERTFEALAGCRRAIVHLYNSTSELQRRVVFQQDRLGTIELAARGTALIRQAAASTDCEVVFQYSPESFTGTEPDFAVEICEAVIEVWRPVPAAKAILNLPATVEMSTPNIFADQVEWFCGALRCRDRVVVSIHPHNDRGTAVAAAELALAAGAERVEGTLFGNGERTGNVDVVTLALNMFSQGIDPRLDLSDLPALIEVAEACTRLPVHARHPYAGELVFTAFSGSHQDAIRKGMKAYREGEGRYWEVPYLPVDPMDIGRSYEPIVRINSQSGKGGIAFLLERELGVELPRGLQVEFASIVQRHSERTGMEIVPDELTALFRDAYLRPEPLALLGCSSAPSGGGETVTAILSTPQGEYAVGGWKGGCADAFAAALGEYLERPIVIQSLELHVREDGAGTSSICFALLSVCGMPSRFGVGIDADGLTASLKAILSAVNRFGGIGRQPDGLPLHAGSKAMLGAGS
jgi:2-isopropylmalate synthase